MTVAGGRVIVRLAKPRPEVVHRTARLLAIEGRLAVRRLDDDDLYFYVKTLRDGGALAGTGVMPAEELLGGRTGVSRAEAPSRSEQLRLASLPLPQLRDLVRELPPHPLCLSPPVLVVPQFVGLGLALELAVVLEPIGLQRSRLDRLLHGAARLGIVAAVAKATAARERRDVPEDGVDPILVEELQRAQARGVEQEAAAGHEDELAGEEVGLQNIIIRWNGSTDGIFYVTDWEIDPARTYTGRSGRFAIPNVPVGRATIEAFGRMSAGGPLELRSIVDIEIEAGDIHAVGLELRMGITE